MAGRHYNLQLTCEKCDHQWEAPITEEYGIPNFDRNEDAFCSECGMEGIDSLSVSPFNSNVQAVNNLFKDTFKYFPGYKAS